MHKIIFICQIVLRTGSAHISLFIDINSKVFGNNGPDAQIKFSFLVQEWLFNVLLNDPKGFFLLFFENELNYVPKLFEYLDATSLVQCSRLNNPHILLAMLVRNSFVPTSSVVDFSEPMHKFIDFPIIWSPWNYESSGCRIKEIIFTSLCFIIWAVECLERFNQLSFCANTSDNFKVVKHKRWILLTDTLINFIVAAKA